MTSCLPWAVVSAGILTISPVLAGQQPVPDAKLDPRVLDPYPGTYRVPSGGLLVVARTERRLYAYEPGSGRMRGLERVDDRTWVSGPSLLSFAPEVYRLTFVKDGVRFASGKTSVLAKRARLYREESVTFHNESITLSGTLFLPDTPAPYPAIALAHGSGAQDRNGYLANIRFLADHLARNGIAVLTYDKRGSGRSSGRWETASFADLAGDLTPELRFFATVRTSSMRRSALGAAARLDGSWPKPSPNCRISPLSSLSERAGVDTE